MKSALLPALALAAAAICQAAAAEPLRADHPLLGAWQYTKRADGCAETYRFDRGGTSLVTSADEVASTHFTLSDQPSARGYYKWVDTLVKDNGKKDCWGQVTKPPRTSTNYILLNPARDRFVMCASEAGTQCIGPFIKVEGGEI